MRNWLIYLAYSTCLIERLSAKKVTTSVTFCLTSRPIVMFWYLNWNDDSAFLEPGRELCSRPLLYNKQVYLNKFYTAIGGFVAGLVFYEFGFWDDFGFYLLGVITLAPCSLLGGEKPVLVQEQSLIYFHLSSSLLLWLVCSALKWSQIN
jgi:hypothetical protein